MRKITILCAFLAMMIPALAQQKTRVSGNVTDSNEKALQSATVTLLNSGDSSLVKVAVADKSGKFDFEKIENGSYLIVVSAVGYQDKYSEIFEIKEAKPTVSLQPIRLLQAEKALAGITITSKKPLIEHKIDRMVVNVDASPTNVGSSALDVLEKSPGISVDKDGNISLKGKEGVMVLVDGRPTHLGGADLANLLRSMGANQLDQIEIMTNPPAKFDAAGNAGIINIKTKKNKQFGYSGSLTLGYSQGRYPKTNEAFNFNYRTKKFNLFTNLSHNYRKRFTELDIKRNFIDASSKEIVSHFDQEARMTNEFNSINAKLGLDYYAGKNTTIGFALTGFSNPGTFINRNHTNIYNATGILQSQTKALSTQDESWKNVGANINFRQVLDTTGKELTSDFDFISYRNNNNQVLSNYYFNALGDPTLKSDTLLGRLPQEITIYSGRADYLHPIKEGSRFEAGIKSSIVRTINNAIYDTTHNGQIIHDKGRSNDFDFEENINAAYVNLSTQLSKKISAQFGLRLENTTAKGRSKGFVFDAGQNDFVAFDSVFKQNYTQLFPTAFFQYKLNEENNFGLNYARRIRRPNYSSLNPFIEYLDRYTYQQGNPNLKPQFSHNIEMSHSFKGILNTTLNYSTTKDIIQQVIEQNEATNETYVKRANIANQRQLGLAISFNHQVNKWWTANVYTNIFNNHFEGIVNNYPVSISATTLMLHSSQQFKIGKTFGAEISGWYRTAGIDGVFEAKPMGMLALGFNKQILKGKGTLILNVRDILWTQGFKARAKFGNVDADISERGDSRIVNLGFTWRFNKGKLKSSTKNRSGSSSDEQNRVGAGN